jgi:hypothetical protein
MDSPRRPAILATLLLFAGLAIARADVLLLKDGKKVEGSVTDKGNAYEVKTKYGALLVDKADVQKVVKDPAQIVAEADLCRKLARGMYDDAMKLEGSPRERNRKLTAGLELLEKALKQYQEAREIFTGSQYEHLDKEATSILQEMRLYRDKVVSEQQPPPPPPVVPPPVPEPAAKPPEPVAVPPQPVATQPETVPPSPVPPAPVPDVLMPPVKPHRGQPATIDVPAAPKAPDVPAAPKTPKELIADLGSPDAGVRRAAVAQLGKAAAVPEALAPLMELLKKEEDEGVLKALAPAVALYDGAALAKQEAFKVTAQNGPEARKRVVIAAFKKTGGEQAMRFLIDQFVAKGQGAPLRNEVASALKKHKALAVKPLIELFRKAAGRQADIQVDVVKYLGIIGEYKIAPQILIPLLDVEAYRNVTLHALRKIDKPVIPLLIQNGLPGSQHVRLCAWALLKYFTGQTHGANNAAEWTQWWAMNRRGVEAEEAKWNKADEACDWLVDNIDWSEYEADLVGNLRWLAYATGHLGMYESSRGRPRGEAAEGEGPPTDRMPRRFRPFRDRGN